MQLNSKKIISIANEELNDDSSYEIQIDSLKKQKNLLQDVIDKVPNLISVRDASGKFILVNKAIANVYGYEVNDLIGRNDEELTHHPWKIESCIEIDTMVMQQKQERTILEETITDKNGKKIWLQTTKQPFIDTANNELYVLGVSTNITQQRIAKEKLIQSEKRFKDFSETAANIFWELDKDLNYTYISGSIKNLIGDLSIYPLGKSFDTLFSNSSKCEFDFDAYKEMLKCQKDISNFTFNVKNENKEVDYLLNKRLIDFNQIPTSLKEQFNDYLCNSDKR